MGNAVSGEGGGGGVASSPAAAANLAAEGNGVETETTVTKRRRSSRLSAVGTSKAPTTPEAATKPKTPTPSSSAGRRNRKRGRGSGASEEAGAGTDEGDATPGRTPTVAAVAEPLPELRSPLRSNSTKASRRRSRSERRSIGLPSVQPQQGQSTGEEPTAASSLRDLITSALAEGLEHVGHHPVPDELARKDFHSHAQAIAQQFLDHAQADLEAACTPLQLKENPKNVEMASTLAKYEATRTRLRAEEECWDRLLHSQGDAQQATTQAAQAEPSQQQHLLFSEASVTARSGIAQQFSRFDEAVTFNADVLQRGTRVLSNCKDAAKSLHDRHARAIADAAFPDQAAGGSASADLRAVAAGKDSVV
eukprot:m.98937 g.98937  ORF g.98937 m.98937 type:complete len:364 (+) comp15307_c0_seq2:388-1479(+)